MQPVLEERGVGELEEKQQQQQQQ